MPRRVLPTVMRWAQIEPGEDLHVDDVEALGAPLRIIVFDVVRAQRLDDLAAQLHEPRSTRRSSTIARGDDAECISEIADAAVVEPHHLVPGACRVAETGLHLRRADEGGAQFRDALQALRKDLDLLAALVADDVLDSKFGFRIQTGSGRTAPRRPARPGRLGLGEGVE